MKTELLTLFAATRMQQASRKVNVGILASNQVNSYINHGGAYGR